MTNNLNHVFRHVHCDPLDGTSLAPALKLLDKFKKGRPFSLTQRLSCKWPNGNHHDNDPYTKEWIDFCPFKKLPRDPPFGAMGYAIRSKTWRYIAWLEWDTSTYLPSIHLPPMAEELYDHKGDSMNPSNLGQLEIENLAHNNEYHDVLTQQRVLLYDFLWYNASFEHLFQKRQKEAGARSIVMGRHHPDPQILQTLHPSHHFSHNSEFAKNRKEDNKNLKLYATLSGLVNKTSKGNEELSALKKFEKTGIEPKFRKRGRPRPKKRLFSEGDEGMKRD